MGCTFHKPAGVAQEQQTPPPPPPKVHIIAMECVHGPSHSGATTPTSAAFGSLKPLLHVPRSLRESGSWRRSYPPQLPAQPM